MYKYSMGSYRTISADYPPRATSTSVSPHLRTVLLESSVATACQISGVQYPLQSLFVDSPPSRAFHGREGVQPLLKGAAHECRSFFSESDESSVSSKLSTFPAYISFKSAGTGELRGSPMGKNTSEHLSISHLRMFSMPNQCLYLSTYLDWSAAVQRIFEL